jgi:hypothetical protein
MNTLTILYKNLQYSQTYYRRFMHRRNRVLSPPTTTATSVGGSAPLLQLVEGRQLIGVQYFHDLTRQSTLQYHHTLHKRLPVTTSAH